MPLTSNPATQSPESVLQQLQWRYAVKSFDPTQTIPADVWQALEQSLVLAPSSFGLQPWKFWVLTDRPQRESLLEHSWGQRQVVDASHLVVFAIKTDVGAAEVDRYIERMAEVRATPAENLAGFANMVKGFIAEPPYPLEMNAWATRQVYVALGQFMTCAAMLGIDTCPMEGFLPDKYDEALGLAEQGYHAVVLCPAGYRAADDKYATMPKVRYPTEAVVSYVTP